MAEAERPDPVRRAETAMRADPVMGASIVTLTLNPALDVSSSVGQVVPTHKLRCTAPLIEPGGGGINVARVCHRMGIPTLAVATAGGTTGSRLADLLRDEALPTVLVEIDDETRQSLAVLEQVSGDHYRFVLPGPSLSPVEIEQCFDRVVSVSAAASCVVVSGSMPPGLDGGIIADLVRALRPVGVIVDTQGPALRAAIEAGCHLAKPNVRELASLVGRQLETEIDIVTASDELMALGSIEHLVVSLGEDGVLAKSADGTTTRMRAPSVDVQSAVGAGDSMVAGLAIGVHRGVSTMEMVALGVAAGTAAVLTPGSELCRPVDLERMHRLLMDR